MAKKQEIQDKRFELYERAHTKEYYAVAKWLSEVSFAPAVLGVDQVDVWRKIEKLCELYEAAIYAESWLKSGMTAVGIEYLEDKADEMCTIDFGD